MEIAQNFTNLAHICPIPRLQKTSNLAENSQNLSRVASPAYVGTGIPDDHSIMYPHRSDSRISQKEKPRLSSRLLMFALPIFTARAIYRPAARECPVDTRRHLLICLDIVKAPHLRVELCVRVTYFHSQSPGNYAPVNVLNFCVRNAREPERRLRRMKRGRSVCSGLQKTSLLRQAMYS